jgi:hypothetical protein
LYDYRHFGRYGDYYTLYFAKTRRSVLFSSEPLTSQLEWHPMGNRELIRARLDGNGVELRQYGIAHPVA